MIPPYHLLLWDHRVSHQREKYCDILCCVVKIGCCVMKIVCCVVRVVGHSENAEMWATLFLPFESLKKLYLSVVEPHFRYCCSVWGCCGSTGINHLQKLQDRAARIVTSSSIDAPSRPLMNELGWKTIDELVDNESKVMVYISQHQLAPQYLSSMSTKKLKSLLKEP